MQSIRFLFFFLFTLAAIAQNLKYIPDPILRKELTVKGVMTNYSLDLKKVEEMPIGHPCSVAHRTFFVTSMICGTQKIPNHHPWFLAHITYLDTIHIRWHTEHS